MITLSKEDAERELKRLTELEKKKVAIRDALLNKKAKSGEDKLIDYTEYIWRASSGKGEFKRYWHMEAICDHLEALYSCQIKKLAIQVPFRHGKSTLCSEIFPTWLWVKDPSFAILSASYGSELAIRDAIRSRDILNNELYKRHWGNKFKLKSDSNKASRYDNDKGGYRISTSVDGKGTGEGADLIIIDDPHKAKEFSSNAKRKAVIEWYTGTIQSRFLDPLKFRELLIHQRGHDEDLIGYMTKAEEGEWTILDLPVEYIPTTYVTVIGWKDPRTKEGEWLCEDRLPIEEGYKIKKYKPNVWAAQCQQRPSLKGAGYLKEESIKFFDRLTEPKPQIFSGEFKTEKGFLISSIDLADGSSIESDCANSCFHVWGVIGRKRYLLDRESGKWDFPDQIRAFERLVKRHPNLKLHLIEKKSNGAAFKATLDYNINLVKQSKIVDENTDIDFYKKLKDHKILFINPADYGGDKNRRFANCLLDFSEGNVFIPYDDYKPWSAEVKRQILGIPHIKDRDDSDCLSQVLNFLTRNPDIELEINNINQSIFESDLEGIKSSRQESINFDHGGISSVRSLFQ